MLSTAPGQAAQAPATPAPAPGASYLVFLRGTPVGREEVAIRTDAGGTTVTSQARFAQPLNTVLKNAELKYGPDWSPQSFAAEASVNGTELTLRTTFANGTATTEGTEGGMPLSISHPVAAQALVLPNIMFAAHAALARRLHDLAAGAELRVYVVPQAEVSLRVAAVHPERMQMGTTVFDVRRYELLFANPGGELAVSLTATADGALLRVSVPAQSLDIVRDDVAASTSRTQVYSNPGDEAVIIPALGFNIGATLTRPTAPAAPARLPAVILLSGSGVGDRDGLALGVPTMAQLAGAIADAGMVAVRFDKRGYGQSGGRTESATIDDYAEDVRAVVKWLAGRKDLDPRRIAVVGHSEGAWVGLIAAARDKRVAAVVTIAGAATRGAELVLEQQQRALDQLQAPAVEREAKIALQKQIQGAVLTGKGWDALPENVRKDADTPWFQSLLAFDPASVIDDLRQPLLVVHGELDRQVPVSHADQLAALARKESDSKSIEVVIVRGVNHLMVPAITGEVGEYGSLPDRNVSRDLAGAVSGWLTRTFAAVR